MRDAHCSLQVDFGSLGHELLLAASQATLGGLLALLIDPETSIAHNVCFLGSLKRMCF